MLKKKLFLLTFAAVFVTISLSTGCTSYHWGFVSHPQIKTIGISEFENKTDHPSLAVLLRKKLAEHVMRDGSLRLTDCEDADITLKGTIRNYDFGRAGAAEIRDEEDLPDNRSAYQTSIFSVKVKIRYSTMIPGNDKLLMSGRSVTGKADFPEMPDLTVSRQSGLQQALNDAAKQMVVSITEAW